MENKVSIRTLRLISRQVSTCVVPVVTKMAVRREPYLVLISCILSLRTKDKTTVDASKRLFKVADTCRKMARLPVGKIERLIYPVGFNRTKAKVIRDLSRKVIDDFGGRVPDTLDGLLGLKGVGRKTANLVLGLGFNKPAICVDTHVHRISNRLGWIRTRTVVDTERALARIIPMRLWIDLNTILVTFGQNICRPVSPLCSQCAAFALCKKAGVRQSR